MARPRGWTARDALAALELKSWAGHAWRFHRRRYEPTDASGSLLVTGRYHRGTDQFAEGAAWPALYLALGADVAIGEILRHIAPDSLADLNDYRITELDVELESTADVRNPTRVGLDIESLVDDYDFDVTQQLAAAAIERGAEGLLVPSATRLGVNLIIFPARLHTESRLVVIDSRDPRLYVSR